MGAELEEECMHLATMDPCNTIQVKKKITSNTLNNLNTSITHTKNHRETVPGDLLRDLNSQNLATESIP